MTQIMELPRGGGGGGGDAIKINADNHLLIPPNFNSKNTYSEDKMPNEFSDDENTSLDSSVFSNDDRDNIDDDDDDDQISPAATEKINDKVQILIPPNSELPKPEPPPGVMILSNCEQSTTQTTTTSSSSVGSLLWEKSSTFSSAITRRLSSLIDDDDDNKNKKYAEDNVINVTEFNLSGIQVIVNSSSNSYEQQQHVYDNRRLELRGRISFFSKSNCRDCTAVRSFFRQRNLRYVEINIDVFPMRRKELMEKTGGYSVPQIFFNEKLFGGLVALNSLRNSGMFEDKLKELLSENCAETAPAVPVYGCDDDEEEEEERTDEMADVVMILRERLPVQDRLMRMKIVKSCFSGTEVVDVIMKHYAGCDRNLAVEIGKQLAQKHFLHHVFGENEFEDGNHYYRLLEHEPFIPRCFNFQGSTSDSEPNAAAIISERLTKLMSAILESYASEDRRHLNYIAISNSEEFRRYVNLVQKLHRVNIWTLSADEKLAFFLNLYNAMVIHAEIKVGHPVGVVDRRSFNSDFMYVIGGQPYSLTIVKNGILRSNRRAPYALVKSFGGGDKRLELAFPTVNPLIHFGLCNGTRSSPVVRFFTPQGVQSELRSATRDFFQKDGMEVDLSERTVYLTRIINWFDVDFGKEKDLLNWVMKYLDATKAGLLTHLLADGGPVNIVYQNYDWSSNC